MNVNQVMAELRRLQKQGHGKTTCFLYAHDHNPEDSVEGDGPVSSIDAYVRDDGSTIIAIKA